MLFDWADQIPLLRGVAGRVRFRQFVARPIPPHVHDLHGGYRGRPVKGYILTFFSYEPPLGRDGLLDPWEEFPHASASVLLVFFVRPWMSQITKAYTKREYPGRGSGTWLLLDEPRNRGALYVASWYPFSGNEHAPTQQLGGTGLLE